MMEGHLQLGSGQQRPCGHSSAGGCSWGLPAVALYVSPELEEAKEVGSGAIADPKAPAST